MIKKMWKFTKKLDLNEIKQKTSKTRRKFCVSQDAYIGKKLPNQYKKVTKKGIFIFFGSEKELLF
jgi:hypothetical protein